MSFSLPPNASPPDEGAIDARAARLRAEYEATEHDARKGALLHEIGVLEDIGKSEGQAARDLLAAVNLTPDLKEPLERLVVLIERRKSYKNLGKLVDRLVKVAETPEESSRALVSLAEFKEDQEGDPAAAREALERAVQVKADDVDAWLALESLAARTGDDDLRLRALSARADLAASPAWKALLLLDVARLRASAGDVERALEALEGALATNGAATYAALSELERIGRAAGRPELVVRALSERAQLIALATEGERKDARAEGVPEDVRTKAHVGDALLRAAQLLSATDATRAAALLDQVLTLLPGDAAASAARLRAAEAAGDTALAAELAQKELERGVHGPPAAALWMRVAEAAASNGDAETATSALASAIKEDAACIPARALELHLLAAMDASRLAQALESAAAQLGSEAFAAEAFLLAADTWARSVHDVNAAKAALTQAAAARASLELVARTGRALAAAIGDAAWYDEATRRLLSAEVPATERVSLGFELGRTRLLRGDRAAAKDAFAALASFPEGAWLGHTLHAYALASAAAGTSTDAGDAEALESLAGLSPDPDTARALRVAAALRYQLRGALDPAEKVLSELQEADPGDLVVSMALASAYRRHGLSDRAADVLAATADRALDPAVGAALSLESGIVRWLGGNREGAIRSFEHAAEETPEASSGLLAWALRAARPNDVDARRKALQAAAASEEPALLALERFGLDAGEDGDLAALAGRLSGFASEGPLESALELARALALGDGDERTGVLDAIAERSPAARALARSSVHVVSLGAPSPSREAAIATAEAWALAEPSIASALEWAVHAAAGTDVAREVAARELLGERLGDGPGAIVTASARLVQRLAKEDLEVDLVPATTTASALVNLELSPPSGDPSRRAAALLAVSSELEPESTACALSLAGWNLLALGDAAGATRAFRTYLESYPEDIVGWEGLRAAAELAQDKALLAEASAALGDLSSDAGQGAELWERAAYALIDDLGDAARGEAALSRAVARDITRQGAFDRLFRIVRARKDGPRLLELIAARIAVAEDPEEIVKLYWERARVLRESGDAAGALEALGNVTMLEPDHVGGLALTGEIYITEKRFEEAAESLARLAGLSGAPTQQRLMSGIAATDLYENKLGRLGRALEVLVSLHRAGLATLPVRERLARAAAKSEAWETSTEVLEELMAQRETREGRVDAARLALAIHRDRLGAPARAEAAVSRLLEEIPDDGEALDLVLSRVLPKPVTDSLLARGKAATIRTLIASPLDLERMTRIAEIARMLDDVQLRQVTLGAVVALGGQTPQRLEELSRLDGRVARTPQIALDDTVVASLRDDEDTGPIPELVSLLSTTFAEALGPGLAALGVGKKERVRPQDGLPVRNEIAAWAGALALGEFELYVGGRDPEGIYAVATELPAVVVGTAVQAPLSAVHRQGLARELLALKLGMTILRHRDATDIAALVVAACSIGGVRLESPPYAMLAEFERQLAKEMPRRVRKVLPEIAQRVGSSGGDPVSWVRAAKSTLDRMAAVAVGDVSWVLATGERTRRGDPPATTEAKQRASRLLSFVLSPAFFAVREKLGMGVR